MTALFNYFIEVNLGLILFYAFYHVFLRQETDFRANRYYLLGSLFIACIFPLLSVPSGGDINLIPSVGYYLPELIAGESADLKVTDRIVDNSILTWVLFSYLCITVVLIGSFIYQLIKLLLFIRNAKFCLSERVRIIETSESIPSFSFFNYIVIGQADLLSPTEKEQILKHERAHVSLVHSADLLLLHMIQSIFWFNPVVWLYKKSLQQMHEFEADARSIDQQSMLSYCKLLAKVAMAQSGFAMAHHFNQSLTIKRIEMMKNSKQKMKKWKITSALLVAALFVFLSACQDQLKEAATDHEQPIDGATIDATSEVLTVVDETATPVAGMESFYRNIATAIKYPLGARQKGLQGRVYVEFVVNTDGKLSDFKVLKGFDAECNAEALRVVMLSEAWKPARNESILVRQKMVLPITFQLDNKTMEKTGGSEKTMEEMVVVGKEG